MPIANSACRTVTVPKRSEKRNLPRKFKIPAPFFEKRLLDDQFNIFFYLSAKKHSLTKIGSKPRNADWHKVPNTQTSNVSNEKMFSKIPINTLHKLFRVASLKAP